MSPFTIGMPKRGLYERISPPVLPNSSDPSPALESFMAFFDLDRDLATAAQFSPFVESSDKALRMQLVRLPEDEKDTFLVTAAW